MYTELILKGFTFLPCYGLVDHVAKNIKCRVYYDEKNQKAADASIIFEEEHKS